MAVGEQFPGRRLCFLIGTVIFGTWSCTCDISDGS